jgi:hypothetical protein
MNPGMFDEMEALRSLGAADLPTERAEAIGCRCRAELARHARRRFRTARRALGGLELAAAFAVGFLYLVWGFSCASRVFADSRLPLGPISRQAATLAASLAAPADSVPPEDAHLAGRERCGFFKKLMLGVADDTLHRHVLDPFRGRRQG